MKRLSFATLRDLPPDVRLPAYDRSAVSPGVVHLGVGAFHRAHQAVAIDDCLARGERDWGIVAASLRSPSTRDALVPQDCLYTLCTRADDGVDHRVIGSIGAVLVGPENPARLLAALCDPRIRLVTLTITEKGYSTDLASGALRFDDPDIAHDLANPAAPRSAIGLLIEAIARRQAAGARPFTILSCDNLPRNGATLHRSLAAFAAARDRDLGDHVLQAVACPSSMVDRIVPATTDRDRAQVAEALGVVDEAPVLGEPFFQWVIEDRFAHGRPGLEHAGAEMVGDVEPFEHMKLRLLNGAHTLLAAVGRLAGLATVDAAIADRAVRRLVSAYWDEAQPTLAIDAAQSKRYVERLVERFSNRALAHQTAQIATDASLKVPQRILSGLRARRRSGEPCEAMTFAVAAWIRSCGGLDDAGGRFVVQDPAYSRWSGAPDQRQAMPGETVAAFLQWSSVFGSDLPRDFEFAESLTSAYGAITDHGVIGAIVRHFGRA
jgi:fructuronate reductase